MINSHRHFWILQGTLLFTAVGRVGVQYNRCFKPTKKTVFVTLVFFLCTKPNWQVFFVLVIFCSLSNLGDPHYTCSCLHFDIIAVKHLSWYISLEHYFVSVNLKAKFLENLGQWIYNRTVINHRFIEPRYFQLNIWERCHFEAVKFMRID